MRRKVTTFSSNIQTIAFFLYDKECYFEAFSYTIYSKSIVYLRSCLNNNYMIEQFNFDIQLIFAILNGKVSAAINRKLSRNFRQNGMEITPEQWTVLLFLWEKDGVTQQELCNATFKDKPSMTRLIDNMERQHLVVRISDKKDRRTNLIHLTKTGKELEEMARFIANKTCLALTASLNRLKKDSFSAFFFKFIPRFDRPSPGDRLPDFTVSLNDNTDLTNL